MRFPRMHIAESVTNRILNAYDEIQSGRLPTDTPMPKEQPAVASPAMEGAVIESKLMEDTASVDPQAAPESGDVLSGVLNGEDLVGAL